MPARDANDATWYVLRYPEDFQPDPASGDPFAPFRVPSSPLLDPTLFHDPSRSVVELVPAPLDPEVEARPPPGIAVDTNGEVYRVDERRGRLLVRRCDGSEHPLVCEPHVLAAPAGLALDRRGYLYVADPSARRVVVLHPDDGRVIEVLGTGLFTEPIDVAVSAKGMIYVADRAAGRIFVFTPSFRRLVDFAPVNAAGQPGAPRPIAVMIDGDGSVLVADAFHPRLLRFAPDGVPLADAQLSSLVAALAGGELAAGALEQAYGLRAPRFLAAGCCCLPDGDGGVRLAAVHRALRLLALSLGRSFSEQGVFVSAARDGGVPGTQWHRVILDADIPEGTSITVETFTSDSATPPPPAAGDWAAPAHEGSPIPFRADLLDQLIQSPPGRFLWLRVTLSSDGTATPSIRSIRASYPRVSYLELLPAIFQRDDDARLFLGRFLALFEKILTGVEDRYEEFSRELNPDAAPAGIIDWLGALIDLAFDPSWPLERRRALVAEAMELYRTRGTVRGIERYVEIYTGVRPLVRELFLSRPERPSYLGRPGSLLGCGLALIGCEPDETPDETLYAGHAHRFSVYLYLDEPCDEPVVTAVVDRIVEVNKPAHTAHDLRVIRPDVQLGLQSCVGVDFVVGAAGPRGTTLGELPEPTPAEGGGVLGVDTYLGGRRPGYLGPRVTELT